MNLATFCTVILFIAISLGVQILNWWLLYKVSTTDEEWLIIPIIIFLWNVIAPAFLVYKILVEKGML